MSESDNDNDLKNEFVSIYQIAKNNPNLIELGLINSTVLLDLKSFMELKSLEIISLSNCGIKYLCDELFNGLVSVKHLDLSMNSLRHVSKNVFSNGMKNLVVLDLSGYFLIF